MKAYNQSKLANILFTKALAKRLEGTQVTANALHPGVIATDITRDYSWGQPLLQIGTFLKLCKTIPQGAATIIYCAAHPDLEGVSGKYFNNCQEEEPSSKALIEEDSDRLWDMSLQMCQIEGTEEDEE